MIKWILLIGFSSTFIFSQGQAIENVDSLKNEVKNQKDDSLKIRNLRDIGFYYYKKKSPEQAKKYYHEAIKIGNKINEDQFTISSLSQLAILYNKEGTKDSVDFYLNEVSKRISLAKSNVNLSGFYQASTLIYKERGDYTKAIEFAEKNVQYLESTKASNSAIAGAYHNLSSCYWASKKLNKALDKEFIALELFTKDNNETGIAYCNNTLGNIYNDLGQHKEALKYLEKSLEFKQKQSDKSGIANSYLNLSNSYLGLKQYDKSLEFVRKSLKLNEELKRFPEDIKYYWQIGKIYKSQKDTLKAIEAFDKAINLAVKFDKPILKAEIELERNILSSPITSSESLPDLLNNLNIAREKNDSASIKNHLQYLFSWHYKNKNFKEAFDYQQEYYEFQKSMFGPEVLQKLKQLENNFEIQKRENAIQLLEKNKELTEIRLGKQRIAIYTSVGFLLLFLALGFLLVNRYRILQENKRIQELEKMRHSIAGDLHDDIGSTLSSIQILSNLMMIQTGNQTAVKESVQRISHLSDKIANGLREIVWSVNPEHDSLENIALHLRKIANEILVDRTMTIQFEEHVENPSKKLTPLVGKDLFMIFKEIVNNARKYSSSNLLVVQFKQVKNLLTIKISDNGCGFDLEKAQRGNGLNNIIKRSEEMKANLVINTQISKGTSFLLEIPIP